MRHAFRATIVLGAVLSLYRFAEADGAPADGGPLAEYRVGMMESGQYSLEDLAKIFPQFQHKPFDQAGFNALMLPFHYSDPGGIGNANEAGAMSFLMSNDLDWGKGCYCARHAYFVFHRDARVMQYLAKTYTPFVVAAAVKSWEATQAVGGTLIKSAQGYSAVLQIYDGHGEVCYAKTYDKPEPFFDLLADMDTDALTYFGSAPSDKLIAYLRQPRCSPQSLIDLGSVEFGDERSPEEFATYDRILAADPNFGALRYWAANQRSWEDGDNDALKRQTELALQSRVELEPLRVYASNDPAQWDKSYSKWVDKAEQLAGEDDPDVLVCRLASRPINGAMEYMQEALPVASEFPNSGPLLDQLAESCRGLDPTTHDLEMGISLRIAYLQDRYLPGNGKLAGLDDVAWYSMEVGRPDVAMEAFSLAGVEQNNGNLDGVIQALVQAGRYDDAIAMYKALKGRYDLDTMSSVAAYAAFAAAVLSQPDLLHQIVEEQRRALESENMYVVFQGYEKFIHGEKINPQDYYNFAIVGGSDDITYERDRWSLVLASMADAAAGKTEYQRFARYHLFLLPRDRMAWILFDQYERRNPSWDSGLFYDYLGWLYPNDPWVKIAAADYQKRSGGAVTPVDPAQLEKDLGHVTGNPMLPVDYSSLDWNHVPTAWRVASCIHQLLQRGKNDEAAKIAGLYSVYQTAGMNLGTSGIVFTLLRKAGNWNWMQPYNPYQNSTPPTPVVQPIPFSDPNAGYWTQFGLELGGLGVVIVLLLVWRRSRQRRAA